MVINTQGDDHMNAITKPYLVRTDYIVSKAANNYKEHAKANNTKRAYQSDLNDFAAWCSNNNLEWMPATPNMVIGYLEHLADERGYKASTIKRRISAISQEHQENGYSSPTQTIQVRKFLRGLKRKKAETDKRFNKEEGKAPIMLDTLKSMVSILPDSVLGVRDKALLLVGWYGAFRRSEIIAIDLEDIDWSDNGITITLHRSKTNQEGDTEQVSIWYSANKDTCPVRALKRWICEAGITEGAIFRGVDRHSNISSKRLSTNAVAKVVKRTAERLGVDPKEISGHSLRAGLATQAAEEGLSERSIMKQTRHKSVQVLRKYIREGSAFVDNVTQRLGR
jgi:integrase